MFFFSRHIIYAIYTLFFGCCHDVAERERESSGNLMSLFFPWGLHGMVGAATVWQIPERVQPLGQALFFFHAFSVSLFGRCRDSVYIDYIFLVGPKTILVACHTIWIPIQMTTFWQTKKTISLPHSL